MEGTWIVVANSVEARIYSAAEAGEPLRLEKELHHPESRKRGAELASDRPGHARSKGTGHGVLVEPTDPKEFEVQRFASELAHALDHGRTSNAYTRLVLVAAPHFHGMLKKELNKHVLERVVAEVEKDYTRLSERDLMAQLRATAHI